MGEVEHGAGALFEHVAVQALGTEQGDPALQRRAIGGELGLRSARGGDLLAQLHPGAQAAIALDRVVGEVAEGQRAKNGRENTGGAAAEFLKNRHASKESRGESWAQQE